MIKVGLGYDIHRLEKDRPLYLGGILIPHHLGLSGHSDGDCLIHAVIDALSGAAGFPDIGRQFPDTDETFKGIRSTLLLSKVAALFLEEGFRISHIDTILISERPRLGPYIPEMQSVLAGILGVSPSALSIKAKTNEGLGEIGREEAIAAWSVALIQTS
jgi:2-C-methyl-D-erythritol 2,4-cyclodiphosphate synthase